MDAYIKLIREYEDDSQEIETIPLNLSMSWMLAYERSFKESALVATRVLLGLEDSDKPGEIIAGVLWSLVKNENNDVEAADEWLEKHQDFDWLEAVKLVRELILIHHAPSEEAPSPSDGGTAVSGEQTLTLMIAAGVSRGLKLNDMRELTYGQWVDYIRAHDRMSDPSFQSQRARPATQGDINRLLGG